MIKIKISKTIIDEFSNGVKNYIRFDVLSDDAKIYFTDVKIKEIIECLPENFTSLAAEIEKQKIDMKEMKLAFIGSQKKDKTKSGKYNGYNKFSSKHNTEYRAYNLAEALGVNVCPYCNKNYTYTVVDESDKDEVKQYTRPDFDHFLSKEKHPYFALSIYNLIPSCQICNRTLKLTKEFTVEENLHPYMHSFNRIKKISTSKPLLLCRKEKDFEITFKDKIRDKALIKKANKNIEDLALSLQYNKHKDIALELKDKYQLYNDDSIKNQLKDTKVFKEKGEKYVKRLILGSYLEDKDINKRPLSKLIKDISEELELI